MRKIYSVEIKRNAQKELAKIDEEYRTRIAEAIRDLASNPRPNGCSKLKGAQNVWRIRVGIFRVIYEIYDDVLLVHVVRVKHRKDSYWDY